jgi:FMN reductase (NADPH)
VPCPGIPDLCSHKSFIMIDTIFNHRSIRKYRPDPLPERILERVLEAGSRASTTGNMQVYSMIVTTEEAIRRELWECHFKQDMVLQAPVHVTFCADFNRFNKWCRQRKAEPGYDNFLSFFTAAIDALLASQNVVLAAEAEGLGICYLGTATYMAHRIVEVLGLPHGVVPVAAIVMGYPDEDPDPVGRLPMRAVLHRERYLDYTPGEIDGLYAEREASSQTAELLKENGRETLAQVFTDNRYTKKDNVEFSRLFLEVIRGQGFFNQ